MSAFTFVLYIFYKIFDKKLRRKRVVQVKVCSWHCKSSVKAAQLLIGSYISLYMIIYLFNIYRIEMYVFHIVFKLDQLCVRLFPLKCEKCLLTILQWYTFRATAAMYFDIIVTYHILCCYTRWQNSSTNIVQRQK